MSQYDAENIRVRHLAKVFRSPAGSKIFSTLAGGPCGPIASVRQPAPLGTAGILDIQVATERVLGGVEAKVGAGETLGQLDRYAKALAQKAAKVGKAAVLVFLTEVGCVPQHPEELRSRHPDVKCVFATWDEIADAMRKGGDERDAAEWNSAIDERRTSIRTRETITLSGEPLPTTPNARPDLPEWIARGCGNGALAIAVSTALELEGHRVAIVQGPKRGANGRDVHVDLAASNWTFPLSPLEALSQAQRLKFAQLNPFGDQSPRLTFRVRFQMDGYGRLKLELGSTLLPYLKDVPSRDREPYFRAAAAAIDDGDSYRFRLRDALREEGISPKVSSIRSSMWQSHHVLVTYDGWPKSTSRVVTAVERLRPVSEVLAAVLPDGPAPLSVAL